MVTTSTTLIVAMTMAALVQLAAGGSFNVGGKSGGWDLNTKLQAWATTQSFKTGDSLTFAYGLMHSVMEVSKTDYDACQTSNALQVFSSGKTVVTLLSPGKRYFICGTPGHCSMGMKVEIDTVSSAVSSPPPVPLLTPPPAPAVSSPPPAPLLTPPPAPAVSSPPPAPHRASPPPPSPTKHKHHSPPPKSLPPAIAPTKGPSTSQPVAPPTVAPSTEPSMSPLSEPQAGAPQASAASGLALWRKAALGFAGILVSLSML